MKSVNSLVAAKKFHWNRMRRESEQGEEKTNHAYVQRVTDYSRANAVAKKNMH